MSQFGAPPPGWPEQWPWPLPGHAYAADAPVLPYASRGLVPSTFADQWIKFRIPYTMPGEMVIDANSSGNFFPEDVFNNASDKPFEVWRMVVRLTAVTDDDPRFIYDPQPTTLGKHVRIQVHDTSFETRMNKAMQLVDGLQKDDELTWEWEVPYTIVRSQAFSVQADATALPRYCLEVINLADVNCTTAVVAVPAVRVEVTFQGYFLILQPPSETR
jgi:hypothetical protein